MAIYIENEKSGCVKTYDTSLQVEKAIELLLEQNADLISSESIDGCICKVEYVGTK